MALWGVVMWVVMPPLFAAVYSNMTLLALVSLANVVLQGALIWRLIAATLGGGEGRRNWLDESCGLAMLFIVFTGAAALIGTLAAIFQASAITSSGQAAKEHVSGGSVTAWRSHPQVENFRFVDGIVDVARAESFSNFRTCGRARHCGGQRGGTMALAPVFASSAARDHGEPVALIVARFLQTPSVPDITPPPCEYAALCVHKSIELDFCSSLGPTECPMKALCLRMLERHNLSSTPAELCDVSSLFAPFDAEAALDGFRQQARFYYSLFYVSLGCLMLLIMHRFELLCSSASVRQTVLY